MRGWIVLSDYPHFYRYARLADLDRRPFCIALDGEQTDGCALAAPEFHHRIHDWYKRVIERCKDTAASLPIAAHNPHWPMTYRPRDNPWFYSLLFLIVVGRSVCAAHWHCRSVHELGFEGKTVMKWPSGMPSGTIERTRLSDGSPMVVGSSSAIGDALVGRQQCTGLQVAACWRMIYAQLNGICFTE